MTEHDIFFILPTLLTLYSKVLPPSQPTSRPSFLQSLPPLETQGSKAFLIKSNSGDGSGSKRRQSKSSQKNNDDAGGGAGGNGGVGGGWADEGPLLPAVETGVDRIGRSGTGGRSFPMTGNDDDVAFEQQAGSNAIDAMDEVRRSIDQQYYIHPVRVLRFNETSKRRSG